MLKSAVTLAFIASISTAHAQESVCGPINVFVSKLHETYGEAPVLLGKTKKDGMSVLITGTPDGKSWSILLLRADGIACFMATGIDMQEAKKPNSDREL